MIRNGNRSPEVSVDDEVLIAADFPGVWLPVLAIGPDRLPFDNSPVVTLRAPNGQVFQTGAGAIIDARHPNE